MAVSDIIVADQTNEQVIVPMTSDKLNDSLGQKFNTTIYRMYLTIIHKYKESKSKYYFPKIGHMRLGYLREKEELTCYNVWT